MYFMIANALINFKCLLFLTALELLSFSLKGNQFKWLETTQTSLLENQQYIVILNGFTIISVVIIGNEIQKLLKLHKLPCLKINNTL